jgi:hypothetical protein
MKLIFQLTTSGKEAISDTINFCHKAQDSTAENQNHSAKEGTIEKLQANI